MCERRLRLRDLLCFWTGSMTRLLRAIRALGGAPRPPERRANVPTLDPLMSNGGQNPPCSKGRYGRKFRRFCQEDGVVRGGREEGRGTPVFPSACGFADQGATLFIPAPVDPRSRKRHNGRARYCFRSSRK